MCDWAYRSEGYNKYVEGVAKILVTGLRTKPDELVKVSAAVIEYAYANYEPLEEEFRELDLAVDVVNKLSEILEKP